MFLKTVQKFTDKYKNRQETTKLVKKKTNVFNVVPKSDFQPKGQNFACFSSGFSGVISFAIVDNATNENSAIRITLK